ncbi:MAG: hypothetical protein DWQ47_12725 [Acidobacteria bacterium]|nr:MAG: hypothetical protein DWQ32_00125 [Acidobacteriota bacterium]REK03050.1 MAG: hypothetical protein DWQ38_12010 [Acidobacteriota bacterium]REK13146.1 MAG: hypothetical protein DWQ43_05815 [Acidobacteriota bacterium]REK41140.1 MAG: hypothetical protein DWQ47_12725 [Acidobacteriota bacterium]
MRFGRGQGDQQIGGEMPKLLRVFRATVRRGKVEEFTSFFVEVAVPLVKSFEGMESVVIGLPEEGTEREFMMTTTWKDVAALKKFAGKNWRNPMIHPKEKSLLKELAVHHYWLAE